MQHTLTWISNHDDRWLFTFLYVGLAVVLSLWISLFWLVAVVAVHGWLEWVALGQRGLQKNRLGNVLWHIKLDIGLVIFALCLGVYMEAIFGVLGLSAATRTGAQATARFASWQHVIRGALLTADDVAQVAKAIAARKNGNSKPLQEDAISTHPWRDAWSLGDWIGIVFIVLFTTCIVIAPIATDQSILDVLRILTADLHPWP